MIVLTGIIDYGLPTVAKMGHGNGDKLPLLVVQGKNEIELGLDELRELVEFARLGGIDINNS